MNRIKICVRPIFIHWWSAAGAWRLLCKSNFQFDTRFGKSRYKFSFIDGAPQAHGVSYINGARAALLAHAGKAPCAPFSLIRGAPQARVVFSENPSLKAALRHSATAVGGQISNNLLTTAVT
jgi:hypothetical protein